MSALHRRCRPFRTTNLLILPRGETRGTHFMGELILLLLRMKTGSDEGLVDETAYIRNIRIAHTPTDLGPDPTNPTV